MTAAETVPSPAATSRRLLVGAVGLLVLAALFVAGLLWAKWLPYAHKASGLSSSHSWAGGSMLAESGTPGAAPSIAGAWRFTTTYLDEVWKGFAVALLVAATVDALVPRAWLTRVLNRRSRVGQVILAQAHLAPQSPKQRLVEESELRQRRQIPKPRIAPLHVAPFMRKAITQRRGIGLVAQTLGQHDHRPAPAKGDRRIEAGTGQQSHVRTAGAR